MSGFSSSSRERASNFQSIFTELLSTYKVGVQLMRSRLIVDGVSTNCVDMLREEARGVD
jgi:hypothetical protein